MFEAINPTDFAFSSAVQSISSAPLDLVFQATSFLLSHIAIVLVVAWLYWDKKEQKSFYWANLLMLSALFSEGLKQVFARPRPQAHGFIDVEKHLPAEYGFPSGHATLAGAVFSYAKKYKKALLVLALLVALSRVYLGAHFLSDVAAGLVLGYFVGKLNAFLEKKTRHMHFKITKIKEEAILFIATITVIAIILFCQQYSLAAVLIGYYAGFSLLKELGIRQSGKSLKRKAIGFAVLGVLALSGFSALAEKQVVVFLFAGLWISLIYPLVCEKFLKPAKHLITGQKVEKSQKKRKLENQSKKR